MVGLLKNNPATTEIIMRHDGSLVATHYLPKAVKALGWKIDGRWAVPGHGYGQHIADLANAIRATRP